jgi:hypothetical protein
MDNAPPSSDSFTVDAVDRDVEHGILDEEARIACSNRLSGYSLDLCDPGFLLD